MLKQKATRAITWSALSQVVQQGVFFVVSVTLTRLVAPKAYGTVALLSLFTGVAGG
jgi:O-antigen/teichoic acid export membrane protein